jgi:hypothetical protein
MGKHKNLPPQAPKIVLRKNKDEEDLVSNDIYYEPLKNNR